MGTPVVPPNVTFTYGAFQAAVNQVLTAIAALPYVDISPTYAGVTTASYEDPAGGPVFATMTGTFVWSTNGTPPGPTGNGQNEFIFLKSTSIAPTNGGGLASMDVNPKTGAIVECDVIYTATVATVWGFAGTGPLNCTGIPHEIGHFLGLDHSNLHPGVPLGGTLQPQPLANHTPSIGMAYGTGGFTFDDLPMMVGVYTRTATNYVARIATPGGGSIWPNGFHPDDVAGLARLYPVTAIDQPAIGKRPIGNDTATIAGTYLNANMVGGRPWHNIYVIPHTPTSSVVTPGVPTNGVPSGSARTGPASVVGLRDTATQVPGTGEFRIIGVPAAWLDPVGTPPPQVDVVGEPLGCIGIAPSYFGEAVYDPVLNPTSNVWPPQADPWEPTAMISSDAIQALGSLSILPGTVIDIVGPFAVLNGQVYENVSRPLVEIVHRTLPIPPTGVAVNVYHNGQLAPLVTCTFAGQPITPSPVSTAPYYNFGFKRTTYTVSIPPNETAGPRLVFSALDQGLVPGAPRAAYGRAEVVY